MYSVLIQNKKTIECFHEFHPLFLEALRRNVACCRWLESGTTIDTALPELISLTEDKEEWRAIIVRVEDEESMRSFDTDPKNPYDFLINAEGADRTRESRVPLIRLTHMLGGVPAPEVLYETRKIKEKNKASRVIYIPKRSLEEEMDHASLMQKYDYNGKLPREILIVTLRCREKGEQKSARDVWSNRLETSSSEFWKRNNYPSRCRFLVYDYQNEGAVQKEADLFNFWLCVMLLATNDMDPSSLQAYKLYSMRPLLDRGKMAECFNYKTACLLGVKNFIASEIKRDMELKIIVHREMPEYSMKIPVHVEFPHTMDMHVDEGEFPLCAKSAKADRDKWRNLSTGAEYALENTFRKAERALEESADHMRYVGHMSEEDVEPLDRFQEGDMKLELSGLYERILQTQNVLPGARMRKRRRLEELSLKVQEHMKSRVELSWAVMCLVVLAVLLLLAFLPAVFFRTILGIGSVWGALFFALALLLGFGLTELVLLLLQKRKFNTRIGEYNEELEEHASELTQNISLYTDFVSDMVSSARGNSYLNILKRKKYVEENGYDSLQKHFRAAGSFLSRLDKWSRAFYLKVDSYGRPDNSLEIDTELSPQYCPMYTFETGKEYQVPLNETGEFIVSPFEFVRKLEIIREELYEDE